MHEIERPRAEKCDSPGNGKGQMQQPRQNLRPLPPGIPEHGRVTEVPHTRKHDSLEPLVAEQRACLTLVNAEDGRNETRAVESAKQVQQTQRSAADALSVMHV